MQITERIAELGIVPVVKIENADQAVALGKALINAHLNVIEITFRTAAAADAIKVVAAALPELLVGAGTVLSRKQVDEAILSGAKFIVTPGFNPDVVSYCVEKDIPIIPGCSSPSDIEAALSFGLNVVKFFPAEQLGGLPMIKALSAPYGNVKFIATGGINEKNFRAYLDYPKVIAIAGSWMVLPELVEKENFTEIEKLSKSAVETMLGLSISQVELKRESLNKATLWSDATDGLISQDLKDHQSSVITLQTLDLKRAKVHFQSLGLVLDFEVTTPQGIKEVQFKDHPSGFDVKLIEKK
ncbi:MAG: Entner-Doudoroff aldolase [Erysipelotrichaceae bacterium]|nr:MAG: Entner-Doudoroff [Erysipelotrichaceae bacterium]TXT17240.1 MAG: Entner-Doudoroff aldolase [Erysipelotrichaceae bacterium]